MANRVSTINVIPSTDDTWAVTSVSEQDEPLFFADKADAVTVAKAAAILGNRMVVVYNRQREIESITKATAMFNQRLLDTLNPQLFARMTHIFEELDYRIHVFPTNDHWEASTLKTAHDAQFTTKDEAVKYAYQQALEHGYIIYVYDEDGAKVETIDPEDDLEYKDEFIASIEAEDEYISLSELKRELGFDG